MLIDPTTASKTKEIKVAPGTTLQIQGTIGTDVIALEIPDGQGGWKSVTETRDGQVITLQLDVNNEQLVFYGYSYIRINKPTTANVVGIERYTGGN